MKLEQRLFDLKEEGVTTIPGFYSRQQCRELIQRSEELTERLMAEGKKFNDICQFITSPFRYDSFFLDLLWNPTLEQILSGALDQDYVLINSNLINRKKRKDLKPGQSEEIGGDWHTDSRYLGGQRLDRGFGYIVVTMFTDFTAENAGTLYVPGSHLRRERPERNGDYSSRQICGEAGTIAIYDSGMWHRAGDATDKDRLGLFSLYGGWFVKPYYRYPEMLGEEYGQKLSKPLRRLLHYTSWPPLHDEERTNTVVREA